MKIAGYEFAEGARFQPGATTDPSAVGRHIAMLKEQFKGELTPEDVLADAKNNNSPLHSFFEWDDSAAAHQHRLNQARGLIRTIVAVYTHDDKPATRMRAYVHINDNAAPHYRETSHAMSVKATRDMVLQSAWREFQSWRRRYADLREFAEIFDAADAVNRRVAGSK